MKRKIFALMLALILVFGVSAVAFAAPSELVHNGELPVSDTQAVTIKIRALLDATEAEEDADNVLPSEYHVLFNWDIQDGTYNAVATDREDTLDSDAFHNFYWDCQKLDYAMTTDGVVDDSGADIRAGNWTTVPKVWFEVINASTPGNKIYVSAAVDGKDKWADLLTGDSLTTQNASIANTEVNAVSKDKIGTGKNCYAEEGSAWGDNLNTFVMKYDLSWDYDKLNAAALAAYKTGYTDMRTNTFTVTVSATATK